MKERIEGLEAPEYNLVYIKDALLNGNPKYIDIISLAMCPYSELIEDIMLEVLKFDGKYIIDNLSIYPHSRSPTDMAKSIAMQYLVQHTGPKYLQEIKNTKSRHDQWGLQSIIDYCVKRVEENK